MTNFLKDFIRPCLPGCCGVLPLMLAPGILTAQDELTSAQTLHPKIYVVLLVSLSILTGILLVLIHIEWRLSKLERGIKEGGTKKA